MCNHFMRDIIRQSVFDSLTQKINLYSYLQTIFPTENQILLFCYDQHLLYWNAKFLACMVEGEIL